MRCVLFYHSLVSDWNHGNAHFLRGVASELSLRGHDVRIFEPEDGWSVRNLKREHGTQPILDFFRHFPGLRSISYDLKTLDLERTLDGADLVIVHEWNDPDLVKRIGELRGRDNSFRLLFHDTHHRSATDPDSMAVYDLSEYDGALAFGAVIRDIYLQRGWVRRAWVWHEAADVRVFRPMAENGNIGDVVWIGNWGDEERTAEYREYFIQPVKALGLRAMTYGVRYPDEAIDLLASEGIGHGGRLPNYDVPRIFGRYRVTLHIPRRPYATVLPGIPTIRPFEALACGIPLICSPWDDSERLFTPGADFLAARNGAEMQRHLNLMIHDREARNEISAHGLRTVRSRHTCAHRVNELMLICGELGIPDAVRTTPLINNGER